MSTIKVTIIIIARYSIINFPKIQLAEAQSIVWLMIKLVTYVAVMHVFQSGEIFIHASLVFLAAYGLIFTPALDSQQVCTTGPLSIS